MKAQLTSMAAQKLVSNLLWPVTSFCSAYARAAERRPFVVGVLTTGIKTSCADLFAQKVSTPFLCQGAMLEIRLVIRLCMVLLLSGCFCDQCQCQCFCQTGRSSAAVGQITSVHIIAVTLYP